MASEPTAEPVSDFPRCPGHRSGGGCLTWRPSPGLVPAGGCDGADDRVGHALLAQGVGVQSGAVIAAWPAAALVFSYELLLWLVRAGAGQAEPVVPTGEDAALAAYRASVASDAPPSARPPATRHGINRRQAGGVVARRGRRGI
jgi:hypothetical protein